MKDTLLSLVNLQEVDNQLQIIEDQKGDLPQQVKRLKDELRRIKENHETASNQLTEAKGSRLNWEGELKVLQEKLNKYRDQLYAVSTNREYDAITLEIDTIKEKISDGETQILELLEKEEELTKEVEDLGTQIEMREESLVTKEKDLNQKIKANESMYQDLRGRRKAIVAGISKPMLHQYERIRRGKGKTTVVEINKYACSGCFSTIPPQKAAEIRHMDQLILCESCGRILVYQNENETVAT